MDERQTKIVEGAGLEDSRINREFIDLLQKWSSPVLFVVLLIAGAYWLVNFLEQRRAQKLDTAFASLVEAEADQRPERYLEVAQSSSGQGAVPGLARISAADLYLSAYHLRIRPGTLGTAEADQLDDAQAEEMLVKAGELYAQVMEEADGVAGQEILALGGRWGVVAVALSQGRYDDAESDLNEIVADAEAKGFDAVATDARDLLASLPELRAQRQPVEAAPALPPDAPENASEPQPEPDASPDDAPAEEGEASDPDG